MLRWRKVLPVLRREYLSRVQTKAFWISTITVPLIMGAATVLPTWVMSRTGGAYRVAAVTADAGLAQELSRAVTERTSRHEAAGRLQVTVVHVVPEAEPAEQRLKLKQQVVSKELTGVIWFTAEGVGKGEVEYLSGNVTAFRLMGTLEAAVGTVLMKQQLVKAGVAAGELDRLTRRVELRPVRVADNLGETADAAFEKSFALSYILSLTVYMTVLFYGYYVLRGVLEEKSSRIVEIIVANLRPMELMVGKIFGVGAVGLTQYAIWVFLAVNTGAIGAAMGLVVGAPLVAPHLLVFFVVFFVCGYFQFAALYAAVGSAFNSEEEAQQTQSLVGLVMVLAVLLMVPVMSSPDSTLSVVVSLIPLFAPVLFFTRMTVQTPPTWQIVLCLVLLVTHIFVIARFAAAIYRVGILMYGKKPTLREIWQWTRKG